MISSKSLNRLHRRTARARFIGLSLLTSIGIFLLSSGLPSARAMACVAPLTAGFFCRAVNTVVAVAPFNNNAQSIQVLFLGLNLIIAALIIWGVVKIWSAERAGEEYQTLINSTVKGLVALLVLENLANWVVGIT